MTKNWSKILLVSMLVMVMTASLSFATTSRVNSLAGTGAYLSDDSNAYRYYSLLNQYANSVTVELGEWMGGDPMYRVMSLNWDLGKEQEWGTFRLTLNEAPFDMGGIYHEAPFANFTPSNTGGNIGHPAFAMTPYNRFDLGWAKDFSEALTAGIVLTMSGWSYESNVAAVDTTASASFLSVGVGVSWTNNDNMAFDGAFTYGTAGGDAEFAPSTGNPVTAEWDASTSFLLDTRLIYTLNDEIDLIPTLIFGTADFGLTGDDGAGNEIFPEPEGDKVTSFQFGVGANIDVNDSNTLIVAGEFSSFGWEYSRPETAGASIDKISRTYMPTVRMALETQITDNITTRVGAAKTHLGKTTIDRVNGDSTEYTPGVNGMLYGTDGFELSLGVGFEVAEWLIDLYLRNETPFNLGYWLTGYSDWNAGGPIYRASAIYNF